jgi:hypothetical protein
MARSRTRAHCAADLLDRMARDAANAPVAPPPDVQQALDDARTATMRLARLLGVV